LNGNTGIVDKHKEEKTRGHEVKSSVAAQDSESGVPQIGPYNRALGEIYQRLYPEIRRPKPNQEAIAAALQAMQRLTMESDSEIVVEQSVAGSVPPTTVCAACGHRNREGNKFCGGCGVSLEAAESPVPALESSYPKSSARIESETAAGAQPSAAEVRSNEVRSNEVRSTDALPNAVRSLEAHPNDVHPQSEAPAGAHFYHHHYHHHYFQGESDTATAVSPRGTTSDSARGADRLRAAAAAKGEHMTRSEAAVRRLTQEWILACNTRQLEELTELYAADAVILRSNLPPIRGAAGVREFFFSSLEAGLGEVALDPVRVEVVGDLAHEVGRYSALVPGTVGKRREERGKYLWVFAKQTDGEWKLIAECWCSDLMLTGAESDVPKAVPLTAKPAARKS
jgi:uncharacterized protein (TIGR02246 family)